jgi:GNAT superfamily N-acetyltransferase
VRALTIEQWSDNHERWPELVEVLEREDQLSWVIPDGGPLRSDAVVLVAHDESSVLGFLAFIVQELGPPDDCPALGLTEAKVLAFGVREESRRRGVGRALQVELLDRAAKLGCYQARSVTSVDRDANIRLKLSLGFVVAPTIRRLREGDQPAFVFVKRV